MMALAREDAKSTRVTSQARPVSIHVMMALAREAALALIFSSFHQCFNVSIHVMMALAREECYLQHRYDSSSVGFNPCYDGIGS